MGDERGSGRGGRLFEFELKCEGGGMGVGAYSTTKEGAPKKLKR